MAELSDSARNHLYSTDLSGLRVLIVDRHPAARDALRIMLSNLGIAKVQGAGSTTEVLRQAKANAFDIILSDYMLEDGRDGQQLLEELRLQKLIPLSTVFLVVTSERGYHNVVGVAELTPDDYLIKPFTSDQLHARLGRALYRKSELSRILRCIDAGSYSKALAACEDMIAGNGTYLLDAMRLKGEILQVLARLDEAEQLYREVLSVRPLPWASMGLATTLKARGKLDAAEAIVRAVIRDHKHFLAAHDFLAKVLEASGKLDEAQEVLVGAAEISPHNTVRQRVVGDVASRTGDLDTAERAYQNALRRARGSTIASVDDYANLSRVYIAQGKTVQAHTIAGELRRERRLDNATEFTALAIDSLAFHAAGDESRAAETLQKALEVRERFSGQVSERIAVDLAHAALVTGAKDTAHELVRQLVSENPDDPALRQMIETVFERSGDAEGGRELLESVSQEIVRINNEGVRTAQHGDLEGSVELLSQAAERMPNVRFLVNAANAIFTLLDRKGWSQEAGERGLQYLLRAQKKDPRNPKVVGAYEFFQGVAHKYGVSVASLRQQVADAIKSGALK
jgi:DNA-binding response OmpR family regulator/lipopolysaccharide biosynthesis regulator YciM